MIYLILSFAYQVQNTLFGANIRLKDDDRHSVWTKDA